MKPMISIIIINFIIIYSQAFSQIRDEIDINDEIHINYLNDFLNKPLGMLLDSLVNCSIFHMRSTPLINEMELIIGYSFEYNNKLILNLYFRKIEHVPLYSNRDKNCRFDWKLSDIRKEIISQIEMVQNVGSERNENYFKWRILPEDDVICKKKKY